MDILQVRAMKLGKDGIPVKGMLWKLQPDGALINRATGLVLQIKDKKTERKVGRPNHSPCAFEVP